MGWESLNEVSLLSDKSDVTLSHSKIRKQNYSMHDANDVEFLIMFEFIDFATGARFKMRDI